VLCVVEWCPVEIEVLMENAGKPWQLPWECGSLNGTVFPWEW